MSTHAHEQRRAWVVRGRVQGVGFRWWTRHTASRLGLRGTVRNAHDGSVEVEALGAASALDTFQAELLDGPPGAFVRDLQELPPGNAALPTTFEIIL